VTNLKQIFKHKKFFIFSRRTWLLRHPHSIARNFKNSVGMSTFVHFATYPKLIFFDSFSIMHFHFLLFSISILLYCCQGSTPQTFNAPIKGEVSLQTQDSILSDSIRRFEVIQDSLWRKKTVNEAFSKVRTFELDKTALFKCDSFRFEKGNLINANTTHLLLYLNSRDRYSGEYFVYELMENSWKVLLNLDTDPTTQGILFRDINNDGYQDFILEGYGATGSGEKYYNDVYLYNPRHHTLDYIDGLGMNPHFYPREGTVTCYYNASGAWNAEKYQLNWNKLEILEAIEVQFNGMIEGNGGLDCVRKIYRFRRSEKYLLKQDKVCEYPPEYKPYEELIKSQE
jgi:hypothetical protein